MPEFYIRYSPLHGAMTHNPQDIGRRMVACPRCKGESVYAASNLYRPFCSARCKGLDLGAWADEDFRLAAKPMEGQEHELPPPPLQ